MLHRSISAFVRLINNPDRDLVAIFVLPLVGGALVGVACHETGFISWLWSEAMLNTETTTIDRISVVSLLIGYPLCIASLLAMGMMYQWAGSRRYNAAMVDAGQGATGGLDYGLGYWTYTVNGVTARSRFAPR